MTQQFTTKTKIKDGPASLRVTDILDGTLTVDGGPIPETMTVNLRNGTVEWTGERGDPGPYLFEGTHRTPQETQANEATYRQKRAAAYIATISPEGDFQMSVGDVCDALIKMVERIAEVAGVDVDTDSDPRTVEFKGLRDQINGIKTAYPKPK